MAKISVPLEARIDCIELQQMHREHLGGSIIGHPCDAYLYYSFRWFFPIDIKTKQNRIFRLGDAIEELIKADLQRIGMPVTQSQCRVVGYLGHAGGSIDGIVNDMLFEAKSMNVANFTKVSKHGVREANPIYYSQMQYYMGYLHLDKALFVAMNKNTQDYYIQEVSFDELEFSRLKRRSAQIISAEDPGNKVGFTPAWHQCKFCPAAEVCHNGAKPERNCRTCVYSLPRPEGKWVCKARGHNLSYDDQLQACEEYKRRD